MAMISRSARLLLLAGCLATVWAQPDYRQALRQEIQAALEAQRANRLEEAAAGFQKVIQQVPSLAEAHMSLGQVRHQQQRYLEAIPELETALRLKPELKDARSTLGLCYLEAGQPAKAIEPLEKTLQDDPGNTRANAWLGLAYLNAGQARPAVARFEKALEANPGDRALLPLLVRAYGVAAAQLRTQLSQSADSVDAHVALAESYAGCGNLTQATAEYGLASKLDANVPGIQAALGDLLMSSGDYDAAEKAYAAELRISPGVAGTQFRYGRVLAELGRSQDALPFLEKAAALDSSNAETWFYLGKVHFDLGQFRDAEQPFLKALAGTLPDRDRIMSAHYQLGLVYQKLGQTAPAERHLAEFKKLQAGAAEQK